MAERMRDLVHRGQVLSRRWTRGEDRTSVSEREQAEWARDRLELAYDVQREVGVAITVLADGLPLEEARRR